MRYAIAHYGAANGAHQLLKHEHMDTGLAERLRWKTDLPPNPSGTPWEPFFAGYAYDGCYIVQRTKPDVSSKRAGMVGSKLAALSISDLDSRSLEAMLATVDSDFAVPTDPSRSVAQAVDALSESGSVYVVLNDNFIRMIVEVWRRLCESDRSRLVFGVLFTPTDHYPSEHDSLRIFGIHPGNRSRFDDFTIIADGIEPVRGPASRAMLGEPPSLQSAFALSEPTLNQWRWLGIAQDLFDQLDGLDHEDLRSLAALLALLGPKPEEGRAEKAALAAALHRRSALASFEDIRGLRTIPYHSIGDLKLETLLDVWANKSLIESTTAAEQIEAISAVREAGDADSWSIALASALERSFQSREFQTLELLIECSTSGDGDSFRWIAESTGQTHDEAFANQIDNAPIWVAELAAEVNWPATHAASCSLENAVAAWRIQLQLDVTPKTIARLANRTSPSALVDAATSLEHDAVVVAAAKAVVKCPEALSPSRVAQRGWRDVWALSLAAGVDPWLTISPQDALNGLLTALESGEEIDDLLFVACVESGVADLADHPSRAGFWALLPASVADPLMNRTVLRLSLRGQQPTEVEQPLRAAMLTKANVIAVTKVNADAAIELVQSLPNRTHSRYATFVAEGARLTTEQSVRLGKLVKAKNWKSAATYLSSAVHQRPDLRPAAEQCSSIMPVLDRIQHFLGATGPSQSDVSEGLLAVALTLYSNGPEDRDLWVRAGGDPADLPAGDSGRMRWRHSIDMISKGASGAPQPQHLLQEMLIDYGSNQDLLMIRNAL